MRKPPLEKNITKSILKELKAHGWWAVKIHGGPFQNAGLPDILALKDGLLLAIEVKRPGGKATPLQEHVLGELALHGATVRLATCVEDIREIIDLHDDAECLILRR